MVEDDDEVRREVTNELTTRLVGTPFSGQVPAERLFKTGTNTVGLSRSALTAGGGVGAMIMPAAILVAAGTAGAAIAYQSRKQAGKAPSWYHRTVEEREFL